MAKEQWEQIAAATQAQLLSSIPEQWRIPADLMPPEDQNDVTKFPRESGWFTDAELKVLSTPAVELLEKIKSQTWTSEQVAEAFCKGAAAAHQLTNCLSQCIFDDALKRARELDAYLSQTGKLVGPLHGLPISLKDNFNIKGYPSSVGFVSWANDPATYDSTLVELLRDAGAVFYCKTNVPTAMMIAESVNNLFGRTVNPRNRLLTSGGSSGGESALIAFGASPLGVGTDIGGSLRIPSALTGIFTLRPSLGRFPTQGAKSGLAGQEAVNSVNGPMSATLSGVKLFSSAVVNSEPWNQDPKCLPIPWREVPLKKSLKLAVCWDDNVVRPTPPVARALKQTVEKLRAAGHEIVEWNPKLHAQGASILSRMFLADGAKSVRKILAPINEPFRPEMQLYSTATEMGVYDLWQLHLERNQWCKAFLDQWNEIEGLDGILGPTNPHAAVKNGEFGPHVGYTGVFNVLDYSCVSFPTGHLVDKNIDHLSAEIQPLTIVDKQIMDKYDVEAIDGQPISLQIAAKRLEEEKAIAMTEKILEALSA